MNILTFISELEITFWGSFAIYAIGSVLFTTIMIIKYIINSIQIDD